MGRVGQICGFQPSLAMKRSPRADARNGTEIRNKLAPRRIDNTIMIDPQEIQIIRDRALDLLSPYCSGDDESILETIMIRDGLYVGRRFSQGGYSAIWSAQSNSLRLIDAEKRELACVLLDKPKADVA